MWCEHDRLRTLDHLRDADYHLVQALAWLEPVITDGERKEIEKALRLTHHLREQLDARKATE